MRIVMVECTVVHALVYTCCVLSAGVAPPSVVYIQAGQTLNKLTSSTDALSWSSVFFLMFFAVVSLVPVIYKKRLQARFEETKEK